MSNEFDLVIIGGGPAGYVGAIKAAQLGLKVACVEKRKTLGGTCLNVGCIPSKSLLHSSEYFHKAKHDFKKHGIEIKGLELNLKQMLASKDEVVKGLTGGIDALFAKNKIKRFFGTGTIKSPTEVSVKFEQNEEKLTTKNILIATGSEVMSIPNVEIDEKRILSSTGALSIPEVPETMTVIGGGYIGLEMGSVWSRLGSKVTVVEFMDRIVPAMDADIIKQFQKSLEAQGISFKLSTKVQSAKVKGKKVELVTEPSKGGKTEIITSDIVLVAVGRKPNTENLGLENVKIQTNQRGMIEVNEHLQTSIKNIFAVGDVIKGPMLAHKAEEEAIAAVEFMVKGHGHVNYDAIPGVVYTSPEVATVGKTEEEVKNAGIAYKSGKFPFLANSRARANGNAEGFVKIISCAKTDKVLGVHIIGPEAGNLIAEAVLAMEFSASAEDIARTCHAHPTLSEALKEAAMSASIDMKPIHI